MVIRRKHPAAHALTLALCAACTLAPAHLTAQTLTESTPPQLLTPQTTNDALRALSQQAAVIFTGQVTAVRQRDPQGRPTAIVEIDFAVQDAVRGVTSSTYTLREWAALWASANQPFQVGQQYLLLLHAPGPGGLSSPVAGPAGAIPIHGIGTAVGPFIGMATLTPGGLDTPQLAAPTTRLRLTDTGATNEAPPSTDTRVADLRWVATQIVRPATYPVPLPLQPRPIGNSSTPLASPNPAALTRILSTSAEAAATPTPPPTQSTGYTTVLTLLRQWENEDHAAN